jgi:hypothetical protein
MKRNRARVHHGAPCPRPAQVSSSSFGALRAWFLGDGPVDGVWDLLLWPLLALGLVVWSKQGHDGDVRTLPGRGDPRDPASPAPSLAPAIPGRGCCDECSLEEWVRYHGVLAHAIYDRITVITASRSLAPLYVPHASTQFVVEAELSPLGKARAIPWPLDDELFGGGVASGLLVLKAEETRVMIAATGTNLVRDVIFRPGDRYVYASLIPWLPHVDHRDAVARAGATTE